MSQTISVRFKNSTLSTVTFFLNGGVGLETSLAPGETGNFNVIVDDNVQPNIAISQDTGLPLTFTLADQGDYEFLLLDGKVQNFFASSNEPPAEQPAPAGGPPPGHFGGLDTLVEGVATSIVTNIFPEIDPFNPQGVTYPIHYASINVRNNILNPIWFAIKQSNEEQGAPGAPTQIINPNAVGWWKVMPGQELYVYNCYTRVFYWYATSQTGKWTGPFNFRLDGGGMIPMRREDMGASYRAYHPYTLPLII